VKVKGVEEGEGGEVERDIMRGELEITAYYGTTCR